MSHPERSEDRDAAIAAMLPLVPEHGWSLAGLKGALAEPEDAALLFPGGTADLIETYADWADRAMETAAAAADWSELGLTRRVRAVMALRFEQQREHREAIRRALAVLALPMHARLAARITARTVDSIWHAAGDRSADFSWYTKRAILAGVYGSTLLFWLRRFRRGRHGDAGIPRPPACRPGPHRQAAASDARDVRQTAPGRSVKPGFMVVSRDAKCPDRPHH